MAEEAVAVEEESLYLEMASVEVEEDSLCPEEVSVVVVVECQDPPLLLSQLILPQWALGVTHTPLRPMIFHLNSTFQCVEDLSEVEAGSVVAEGVEEAFMELAASLVNLSSLRKRLTWILIQMTSNIIFKRFTKIWSD